MRPFDVSAVLDPLTEVYPAANVLLEAAKAGDRDVRYALSRLWLSEGISFAFKTKPGIYEALRIWLARRLNVQAKQITVVGSGSQGYSLSPDQNVDGLVKSLRRNYVPGNIGEILLFFIDIGLGSEMIRPEFFEQ